MAVNGLFRLLPLRRLIEKLEAKFSSNREVYVSRSNMQRANGERDVMSSSQSQADGLRQIPLLILQEVKNVLDSYKSITVIVGESELAFEADALEQSDANRTRKASNIGIG